MVPINDKKCYYQIQNRHKTYQQSQIFEIRLYTYLDKNYGRCMVNKFLIERDLINPFPYFPNQQSVKE